MYITLYLLHIYYFIFAYSEILTTSHTDYQICSFGLRFRFKARTSLRRSTCCRGMAAARPLIPRGRIHPLRSHRSFELNVCPKTRHFAIETTVMAICIPKLNLLTVGNLRSTVPAAAGQTSRQNRKIAAHKRQQVVLYLQCIISNEKSIKLSPSRTKFVVAGVTSNV